MALNIAEIEAKVKSVVNVLQTVLTDAEAFEGFLPGSVKTVLTEAQVILTEVEKLLAAV
jgi:hypothetical protein